jgi:hypothetical protein
MVEHLFMLIQPITEPLCPFNIFPYISIDVR